MKKKSPIAQELGRRGGKKRAKKYGFEQLSAWGKKGGRPRKTPVHKSPLTKLAVGLS